MAADRAIQVLRLEAGIPFAVGAAVSRKVVYPEMGAQHLTLNYGVHLPGTEFAQHVHAEAEDVIVCLAGQGVVRSGTVLIPFAAGDAVYVPAGVPHGTINTGNEPLVMVSCQAPPDPALYRHTSPGDGRDPGAG